MTKVTCSARLVDLLTDLSTTNDSGGRRRRTVGEGHTHIIINIIITTATIELRPGRDNQDAR